MGHLPTRRANRGEDLAFAGVSRVYNAAPASAALADMLVFEPRPSLFENALQLARDVLDEVRGGL